MLSTPQTSTVPNLVRQILRRRFSVFGPLSMLCVFLGGCIDVVGSQELQISPPGWSPSLSCPKDPRAVTGIKISVASDNSRVEREFFLDQDDISNLMLNVPLGQCDITVEAYDQTSEQIASGQLVDFSVIRGKNSDPIKIQLYETPLPDSDGDGLADRYESLLETDISKTDSDGDSLEDGIETHWCCTDPSSSSDTDGECSDLFIQKVDPPLATASSVVVVSVTRPPTDLDSIELGGKDLVLTGQFNNKTYYGGINKNSILGDVTLSSVEDDVLYPDLFAVLYADPTPTTYLDYWAENLPDEIQSDTENGDSTTDPSDVPNTDPEPKKGGLMWEMVDMQVSPKLGLFILGHPGPGATGAILIVRGRSTAENNHTFRWVVNETASPVSLSVEGQRMAILLRESDGTLKVQGYNLPEPGDFDAKKSEPVVTISEKLPLNSENTPISIMIEPSASDNENVVQVLTRNSIGRVKMTDDGAFAWQTVSAILPETVGEPSLGDATQGCLGFVADGTTPEENHSYIACNYQKDCSPGGQCSLTPFLIQIQRFDDCVQSDNISAAQKSVEDESGLTDTETTPTSTKCKWKAFYGPAGSLAAGAPALRTKEGKTLNSCLLTTTGVFCDSFDENAQPNELTSFGEPVDSFGWQGSVGPYKVMAFDPEDQNLFVINGPKVRRLSLSNSEKARVFPVGENGETALMLSFSPIGDVLDVGRQRNDRLTSLIEVCLHRKPSITEGAVCKEE